MTYNASEGPLEALYQLYELLLLNRLQKIQMAAKEIFPQLQLDDCRDPKPSR